MNKTLYAPCPLSLILTHSHLLVGTQNCEQVRTECTKWAGFFKDVNDAAVDPATRLEQVQICESILLNPGDADDDALLYYNRVLTAETVNEDDKYVITPTGGPFMVAQKYNFESNPEASVTVVEMKLEDFAI